MVGRFLPFLAYGWISQVVINNRHSSMQVVIVKKNVPEKLIILSSSTRSKEYFGKEIKIFRPALWEKLTFERFTIAVTALYLPKSLKCI